MAKIDLDNMDNMYFDVLKEIGNIGAGNATTALAQLLNSKLDMRVPKVALVELNKISEVICGEEEIVVGIYLFLKDDVTGSMMFILNNDSAHSLVNLLMGRDVDNRDEYSEMDISALQEIGNIITGAYLSALAGLTNLKITASIPYVTVDMAAAILSVPAIEFGKLGDKALFIETEFGDDVRINGYFILIPDLASYDKMLSSLGL